MAAGVTTAGKAVRKAPAAVVAWPAAAGVGDLSRWTTSTITRIEPCGKRPSCIDVIRAKLESMRKKLYKVTFLSQGKALELYAHHVGSSGLWGFTEVGEIVFDRNAEGLVIDPTEEKLREEFANTRVLHLPIQCIVRVEEVEKRVPLAIRDAASGERVVMPFPVAPPRSGK
jgi:hypothetical protein